MKIFIKDERLKPLVYKSPWIFPNSIASIEGDPRPGDVVSVFDIHGNFIGYGFYNPSSFFRVRILSWEINKKIDRKLLEEKIGYSFYLRKPYYIDGFHTGLRLINSEGDCLPGFTCDLYEDVMILKITSLGYYNIIKDIVDVLLSLFNDVFGKKIRAIINVTTLKDVEEEGIREIDSIIYGDSDEVIYFFQDGFKFIISLKNIQKTGFYFDQRLNRLFLKNFFDKLHISSILDGYAYTGAFSCYLYKEGREIDLVDSSANALEMAKINLGLNSFKANVIKSDVEKFLKENEKKYDLVLIDPPKLSLKDKDKSNALKKYSYLNYIAAKSVKTGGFLATFSCSGNVDINDFSLAVLDGVRKLNRETKVIYTSINSLDHPYTLSIGKTGYLKFLFLQVL